MIELELRNNPAPLIPGWAGGEQVALGNFDGDAFADTAVVAQQGGSVHLMVLKGPRSVEETHGERQVLLNVIVFDESFRGGGRIAVVPYSLDADVSVPDALLVVAGPGGGPRVARFDFASGNRFDFFAPYDTSFRGGLWISSGDVDGDGRHEALFLPGEGGSPRLVAVDMQDYETETSIWVGDPADASGRARFEPTGGMVAVGGLPHFWIQYGEIVGHRAESKFFRV